MKYEDIEAVLIENGKVKTGLVKKWLKLTSHLPEGRRGQAATMLEAQRRYNESYESSSYFRRMSIPIIYRMTEQMVTPSLVSVQSRLEDNEPVYYEHRNANGRWLRDYETNHGLMKWHTNLPEVEGIDAQTVIAKEVAQEMAAEVDRSVCGDLRMFADTRVVYDWSAALGDTIKEKMESLYLFLMSASNMVTEKCGSEPNWIVTGPEVASVITACYNLPGDHTGLGIQYQGMLAGRWRVYVDPLFPVNSILMGCRGEYWLDAGYVWSPHIMMTEGIEQIGHIDRFFVPGGESYYANIQIINFFI